MNIDSNPMEVRDKISDEDFLKEFGFPNKPVLLKGYMNDWPALRKWNENFFIENLGDTIVKVKSKKITKEMLLKDFLLYMKDSINEIDPFYLVDFEFETIMPELLADYSTPSMFKSWLELLDEDQRPKLRWFYMGPKGSGSPLHLDIANTSAWNGVISGKKYWKFFPYDEEIFLHQLAVDTFNPDYDKFPLFKNAKAITCIQNPGDIVFTPTGWFHQVHNLEAGISITENFINETNAESIKKYILKHNITKFLPILNAVESLIKKK